MEKHVLILATTNDFLLKFEQDNVALLQAMGYTVHYAANLREPAYLSDRERIRARGVVPHHIDIARSPYLLGDNRRALRQVLCLPVSYTHLDVYKRQAQFKLYQVEDGQVLSSQVVDTNGSGHGALAGFLQAQGVDTLLCGGIGGGAKTALAQARCV